MDIKNTLQQAIGLHQNGHLIEAERLYASILAHQPDHADALHLYGLIEFARGDLDQAVDLIRRAIDSAAEQAVFHFNLGNVLRELDALEAAAAAYAEAIRLQPEEADYYNNLGEVCQAQGHWAEAREYYSRAVALHPDDAELQFNLGNACHALQQAQTALTHYQTAIRLQPEVAEFHRALATAHMSLDQPQAALAHYQQAAALAPEEAGYQLDTGACLQRLGRLEDAIRCYQQALALHPGMAQACNNLGSIYHAREDLNTAAHYYQAALASDPSLAEAHKNLAHILDATAQRAQALYHYREALRLQPDDAEVAYKLAALQGDAAPDTAPPEYVARLFDQYADNFDSHLTEVLGYRTPQLLRELFDSLQPAATALQILDLGCGTGLSGQAFHDCAARMIGIDLSPRMIDKAAARGIYTELNVGDVLAELDRDSRHWDLILAADVFVYLGDLSEIFARAATALHPGGWLLFSVEVAAPEVERFVLHEAGRYAHSRAYLQQLAAATGLQVLAEQTTVLRQNLGQDVSGCLYALQAGSVLAPQK
ncbi:MAG: tetratricopeptide repeat protein [Gammaproteobacteria bacterium]